jgi:hypothetical protein
MKKHNHLSLLLITLLCAGCGREEPAHHPLDPDDSRNSAQFEPVINVEVTRPSGGEQFSYRELVTWSAVHSDPDPFLTAALKIDLYYTFDGGSTWTSISSNEHNDGTFLWDVREAPANDHVLLRVTATDTNGVQGSGISKAFSITDRILITDKKGKRWDITHAVETYGMEPEGWQQGIGQYAILPINDPVFLGPGEEGYPSDDDSFLVIGAELSGTNTRAYPIPTIYLHEVVNDRAGGIPIAAVY